MHRQRALLPLSLLLAIGACGGPPEAPTTEPAEAHSKSAPHWDYVGADGPQHWGDLPGFTECGEGRFQSPVDLPEFAILPDPLPANYTAGPLTIVNNGHTVQIQDAGAGTVQVGDAEFTLVQVHFHSPSEHAVGGERYPMEIHFVHDDGKGNYAVIGVFVEEAAEGQAPELWTHLPAEPGEKKTFPDVQFDPRQLMPELAQHYQYAGSLTTPPCTERVTWEVMAEPIHLTMEQIEAFTMLYSANARPLQKSHDWCLGKIGPEPHQSPPH